MFFRRVLPGPQLRDEKIEVGVRIRFAVQCVVPPLAPVRAETAAFHDGTQVFPASRFDLPDPRCSMMGEGIHQVVTTTHGGKFAGIQVIQRHVHGCPDRGPTWWPRIPSRTCRICRCSDSAVASSGRPPAVATSARSSPRRVAGGSRPRASGRSIDLVEDHFAILLEEHVHSRQSPASQGAVDGLRGAVVVLGSASPPRAPPTPSARPAASTPTASSTAGSTGRSRSTSSAGSSVQPNSPDRPRSTGHWSSTMRSGTGSATATADAPGPASRPR